MTILIPADLVRTENAPDDMLVGERSNGRRWKPHAVRDVQQSAPAFYERFVELGNDGPHPLPQLVRKDPVYMQQVISRGDRGAKCLVLS